MSDHLLPHPLAALRAELGLTAGQYLDRLDDVHCALGYGRMAKGRQKVSRWENGVNSPELPARYAMARLHSIRPDAVDELGWPDFLLLAFPDDRPVLDSPWTLAGTVTAVATAARGGSMRDRREFLIASGATLSGLGPVVWITGQTRGRCPQRGVRPGRSLRSSRSGSRALATVSSG